MELAVPLHDVPFVVVDLETTGGSPAQNRITEFGAVRIEAGELTAEFATLVDPGVTIPRSITDFTGISDDLVAGRPPVEAVLPAFLEFCSGAVLVAHNARFDMGFLNANLARLDYPPLTAPVVCTAALARRLVREEVRDCRLVTLASYFRCRTVPIHRALPDARATVEVFYALLERAGSFGVLTLEALLEFAHVRNTALFRARRPLAEGLPHAPGVYLFRSASGEVLYVGKATDLRARVLSYFGADDRRTVVSLLKETGAIDHIVCPTPIEAAVRELRLLRAQRPRFNRRSVGRRPAVFVKLTAERFPRLSIVRALRADGATYLGPLASRRVAERVIEALYDVAPIRRCTSVPAQPCVLAQIGRCLSPCDGSVGEGGYAPAAALVRAAMAGDPGEALARLQQRLADLAAQGRYEHAADLRDRRGALVAAILRTRRITALAASGDLVASRPLRAGRCEVIALRDGALVASVSCQAEQRDEAAAALDLHGPPETAGADETHLLARWLEGAGTRVHRCSGTLDSVIAGGLALSSDGRLRT